MKFSNALITAAALAVLSFLSGCTNLGSNVKAAFQACPAVVGAASTAVTAAQSDVSQDVTTGILTSSQGAKLSQYANDVGAGTVIASQLCAIGTLVASLDAKSQAVAAQAKVQKLSSCTARAKTKVTPATTDACIAALPPAKSS